MSRGVLAQTGSVPEGALDLLRITGARTLGMGQAVTAAGAGAEAVWGNPALIARGGRELTFDFRTKANAAEAEADVAGVATFPIHRVGTVAVFVRYLNNGTFDAVDEQNQPTGSFVETTLILGASFATTFSDRFAAGFTIKQLSIGISCTGDCTQPNVPTTNEPAVQAIDFGGQYFVVRDSSFALGASIQNLGPRFQMIDTPQADPLPARGNLGVLFVPRLPAEWKDVKVRAAADLVTRLSAGTGPGYRFGGEVSYQNLYHLRAGYLVNGPGEVSSATFGAGLSTGRLQFDLAQMMSSGGTQGSRPTLITLRYGF